MKILFSFLIFPGFLFSAVIGLMACWIDRKVTARLQYRVGPPWNQNFYDILKLLGKETIFPANAAKFTFLLAPFLGLLSIILVATILGCGIMAPAGGFSGDLIVIVYLLTIPAIALIIGASSSRNPLASIGASREMKLLLAYELPFILSVLAVAVKSAGAIRLGEIINCQIISRSHILSWSGFLAFLSALICLQAKIGITPFDMSEAEQELMAGVLIEYSGLPLAIFKLTKAILFYVAPVLLICLFLGRDLSPMFLTVKFLSILVAMILIKNTNPRLRIDQALRFFWGPVTAVAAIAVGLALLGY